MEVRTSLMRLKIYMTNRNKFTYRDFSCDVDIFYCGQDVILRFYDSSREQTEEQICNYVLVDSGYGFLCLKYKGSDGLLSGYLNHTIFSNEEIIYAAIEFLEDISPRSKYGYIPYHIDLIKFIDYSEYNGEE